MTVNAFSWKEYTDEEHAKNGDPWVKIKFGAKMSTRSAHAVQKIQETNPYHGTIIGISDKADAQIRADRRHILDKSLKR